MRDENLVKRLAQIIHDHSCDCGSALHLEEDQQAARAVLASGLVVPTSTLLDAAASWEDPAVAGYGIATPVDCAAELRALTQQEPR